MECTALRGEVKTDPCARRKSGGTAARGIDYDLGVDDDGPDFAEEAKGKRVVTRRRADARGREEGVSQAIKSSSRAQARR